MRIMRKCATANATAWKLLQDFNNIVQLFLNNELHNTKHMNAKQTCQAETVHLQ